MVGILVNFNKIIHVEAHDRVWPGGKNKKIAQFKKNEPA